MALGFGELLLVLMVAGGVTAGNNPVLTLGTRVVGHSLPGSMLMLGGAMYFTRAAALPPPPPPAISPP